MTAFPEAFDDAYSRSIDILQEQAQKLVYVEEYNKMYPDNIKSICTIQVSHGFHVDNLNHLVNYGGLGSYDSMSNEQKKKLIETLKAKKDVKPKACSIVAFSQDHVGQRWWQLKNHIDHLPEVYAGEEMEAKSEWSYYVSEK